METTTYAMMRMTTIIIAKSHTPIASAADKIPKNISAKTISTMVATITIKPSVPEIILFHLYFVLALPFSFYINAKSAFAQ